MAPSVDSPGLSLVVMKAMALAAAAALSLDELTSARAAWRRC